MDEFLIFYAPIMVVVASIIISFWSAVKDESVTKK
ncbi:cytochrome bd oxidase small subunit CydS [Niallia endozanthoxylica]